MCDRLEAEFRRFDWQIEMYVVMPDHYHAIVRSQKGNDLPAICKRLHGAMSSFLRKNSKSQPAAGDDGRSRYFNNYWDTCLKDEADWLLAKEYIRLKPVNAELVKELEAWPFFGPRSGNELSNSERRQ
jgi:REP element-mobilizing transposase RayT